MDSTTIPFTIQLPTDMSFVFSLQALVERLQTLTDKRKPRGVRYPLDMLLLVAVLADLALLFERPRLAKGWSDPSTDFTTVRCVEKGHGRLEERTITVSRMLREYHDWPYLDQVFRLERIVTEAGKRTVEVRYGITSLPPNVANAARMLTIARTEWGIENGLHHRRDVTLDEDACQVRRGNAPQVLAALNNVVIGIVLRAGEQNLAAAQRTFVYEFDRLIARSNA